MSDQSQGEGWWLAADDKWYPPEAHPNSLPPPPNAETVVQTGNRARRRRRRRMGWIVAGSVALGILALAVLAIGMDQILTHDLLSADFSNDDGTFATGEIPNYRSEVRDGKYRLTATASSAPVPSESFGFFARTAFNVDIQVSVAALNANDATVGLECVHSVGGGEAGARYMFTASTSDDGYLLAFVTDSIASAEVLASGSGPPLRAGQRLGLRCSNVSITGTIDDTVVISSKDPTFDSFKAAALVFGAPNRGDWIEFDQVTAVVPEH